MMLLLLCGFLGSIHGLQPSWNQRFFSIEGITGDSMYGGGDRYSSGSQAPSRYQTRQTVPYQEQATYVEEPAENNQRRQDSGFQDPGFAIPFRSDFSFSEFGSPFGNPEGFQQFLSGLGNSGNQAPSDFSQQSAPQFPNLGGLNQRRSDNEGQRRPGQNQFKREVPGGQNVRPGGQVARQLDRFNEDFVRPRPVYVPTQSPLYKARTTTNNYQSFNYEPATESEFNRQPVFKPEYIQPQPNFAQDREYKNPGYTSAFKTTKKPIQVAQKKPTDSFVKPFASEDFSFESQKFDIQKEIQQPTEDNSQAYYEDEYEQGPPAAPSGFFHHDNLKNHKLDTTTERFYQEEFYGANSNQDQGPSFFSDQAKNSFFSGNTGDNSPQQPGSGVVESYNPPQNYQPSQQTFQKPPPFTAFSTTERNAAQAFRGNSESFSQNQDSFFPPTSSNPSIYDIKNQEDENSNNNNQGSFTPPKLVERFSVPLVEPSLPFSPPEQQEETHHEHETFEHKEQHEFNGGQVTVERFPAEPVPSPYVPPTQQPALPPYAPAQQPNKQYKEKKPVLSKKPLVPEHKYEQKNYRKPVVAPSSTSEDHPILRVKPAQLGKQQPQQQQAPAEYRSIEEPQGFGSYRHTPGQLEIKEVTREVTTARQLPEFDNDQEIITAFSDFKKSSSHSNKQTFNVNVHASFSPSLNPEDAQRTARGAPLAPAPQARRGGPKRQTIRMKVNPAPQTSSHKNNNNKKHRFIRRH